MKLCVAFLALLAGCSGSVQEAPSSTEAQEPDTECVFPDGHIVVLYCKEDPAVTTGTVCVLMPEEGYTLGCVLGNVCWDANAELGLESNLSQRGMCVRRPS